MHQRHPRTEGADGLVEKIRDWEAKCASVLWLLEKQVMALAKELVRRKTMTGDDMEALLAEYSLQPNELDLGEEHNG